MDINYPTSMLLVILVLKTKVASNGKEEEGQLVRSGQDTNSANKLPSINS